MAGQRVSLQQKSRYEGYSTQGVGSMAEVGTYVWALDLSTQICKSYYVLTVLD